MANYSVDENGRTCGFTVQDDESEAGSFGCNLEVGQEVDLTDGGTGTVERVYDHIQTGNPGSGAGNYVAVDIETEDADCPECGHPKDGSSGHGHCGHECHRQ